MTVWMLWSIATTTLLAISANSAERVAALLGARRRAIWIAALCAGALAPLGIALRPAPSFTPRRVDAAFNGQATEAITLPRRAVAGQTNIPSAEPSRPLGNLPPFLTASARWSSVFARMLIDIRLLDRWVLRLWLTASLLLLTGFIRAIVMLQLRQSRWRAIESDGRRLLAAPDVGPAVVGFFRPKIVVPEWVLSLDGRTRDLILEHEAQHVRARDPGLLLAAGILLVLFPWNAALWWMTERLRLAIEVDCDTRVIRAGADPHAYGLMLLSMNERYGAPVQLATALAEPVSSLEMRINAIAATRYRRSVMSLLPFATLSLVAIIAAACAPRPASFRNQAVEIPRHAVRSYPAPGSGPAIGQAQADSVRLLPGSPAPRYPDSMLQGSVEGAVLLQFPVDTFGRVDEPRLEVLAATNDAFAEAASATLRSIRFSPATWDGRKVKQLVQIPFEFRLAAKTSNAEPSDQVLSLAPLRVATAADPSTKHIFRLRTVAVSALGARPADDSLVAQARASTSAGAQIRTAYFKSQVEKQAAARAGNPAPRYPDALRAKEVDGDVVIQFVVDESGAVDVSTFKILKIPDPRFAASAREALTGWKFSPAESRGRRVRQVVQMHVQFNVVPAGAGRR